MTYQPALSELQATLTKASIRAARSNEVQKRQVGFYERVGKRLFDLSLIAAFAPIAVFLVLLVAPVIAMDGRSPFYGHLRVGKNGKMFRCWKLRTMVPDADRQLRDLLAGDAELAREWAETQKIADDQRVTWIGRALRSTSLDELPQIWNVLKGEMSVVGPRPVTAEELARYGTARGWYLSVRPGLTGIWQVSGRNRLTYAERVAMDRLYAKKLSVKLDIKLLVRTIPVVFLMTGH